MPERISQAGRPADTAWQQTGGHPDGMVQLRDQQEDTLYFAAPRKFLGNMAPAYGRQLSFDFSAQPGTSTDQPYTDPDIILQGAGQILVIDAIPPTPTTWTLVQLRLNETAGWKQGSLDGPAATRQQIRTLFLSVYIGYDHPNGAYGFMKHPVHRPPSVGSPTASCWGRNPSRCSSPGCPSSYLPPA
jgi:hypothetical protein